MMKVINLLLSAVLVLPAMTSGDELNGYLWERMDESYKYFIMVGYVNGFWHGTVYGADFGVNATSRHLKDLGATSVYGVRKFKEYSMCGATIDKNREIILRSAARYAKNSLNNPIDYYVREVDSFYQHYPSCKGRDLMDMLTDVSLSWLRIRTYKDIGEECSKKNDNSTISP